VTAFVWLGGGLFVSALAFCGYSYGVTWARVAPFDPVAAVVDAVLFSVFALHHSLFARERVKQRLSASLPETMLRSVYVWLASALLIAVCVAWQPVGGVLYHATGFPEYVLWIAQACGVVIIAAAVRAIDPLELAGIRQHPTAESLQIVGPYRWVRHPLYSGWLLLTFGAPHMTGDRLFFAAISTLYLVVAMPFEERSLRMSFGNAYDDYTRRVRFRLIPYVY
jgi:protein-S-isoprenylcysteine O-methyltransferase Ste14